MENLKIKQTSQNKSITVFKILFIISYLLVTAFLLYGLIDSLNTQNVNLSIALYLAILVIIFGTIGFIISLIFAIIGFIISLIKKSKGNIILFTVFSLLPILTEAIFIIICKLLT